MHDNFTVNTEANIEGSSDTNLLPNSNCNIGASVSKILFNDENEIQSAEQNKDANIQYTPLNVSFDNVLKYKVPTDIKISEKSKEKVKVPKAISAQAWRDYQNQKENKKNEKAEEQKKRKDNQQ